MLINDPETEAVSNDWEIGGNWKRMPPNGIKSGSTKPIVEALPAKQRLREEPWDTLDP